MSCENVQELISSILDRRATGETRESALAHLESCRDCSAHFEAIQNVRASLRKIEMPAMPSNLKDQLRVLASHDRVRRLSQASCSARLRHWGSRLQLAFDNLMRPIALPFAGGVLSALFLFGMWVPTMATPRITMGDVPVPIYTPVPPMALINPVSQGGDVVVQLIIDERGRVTDYTVIHGQDSPELMNMILFSKWAPATFFGQPTWGTAVWSHSEIKVKG